MQEQSAQEIWAKTRGEGGHCARFGHDRHTINGRSPIERIVVPETQIWDLLPPEVKTAVAHFDLATQWDEAMERADFVYNSTKSAKRLTAFSIGVHLAEALDMVLQGQASKLLVHHLFVITCFASALLTDRAVGFAVLSLVTEVNSVFNKTRIIHLVAGLSRGSDRFQRNAKINLATFVVRMVIVAWMNIQSFLYFKILPLSFLLPCNVGLLFVNLWNVSVFKQLVFADLVSKTQPS